MTKKYLNPETAGIASPDAQQAIQVGRKGQNKAFSKGKYEGSDPSPDRAKRDGDGVSCRLCNGPVSRPGLDANYCEFCGWIEDWWAAIARAKRDEEIKGKKSQTRAEHKAARKEVRRG